MSFHDTSNPTGGVPMERVIDRPIPEHHLLERILSRENMEWAWKRVRANKGAPGVDDITIDQFPDHCRPHWAGIRESLATGTYLPQPVLRVEIPKPTGGTRPLGIPTVLDRLSFLGFVFKGTRILWSDKAYKKFRRRVRKYTGRSWFVSMQ